MKTENELALKRRPRRRPGAGALLALLALLASCEPEPVSTAFPPLAGDEGETAEMALTIAPAAAPAGTKAPLLRDAESRGSGALVLVYRSATRQLDSYRFFTQDELRAQAGAPLRLRVPLTDCDFYILGNLNGIHRTEGRAGSLMEALGADFPVREEELEALVWRLDGGALNGNWRRQTFAECAALGIPYAHVAKGVSVPAQIRSGGGIPGAQACRRLFSKVTVTIDRSAFDGAGSHPGLFVNRTLRLRQANARLQPFSLAPQKASEAADVLPEGDYDPDMEDTGATSLTYSFYVPENMQGTLLGGNADPARKTPGNLGAAAPYCTYVEFTGRLDPAAGGYGGGVTYRFFVGRDNCSNFDLERGRQYNVTLGFRVGSLFEPDWKVETDGWSDTRLFCLTADPAFKERLSEGRTLAVRANRAGALYVYMNPAATLGSTNALLGRDAALSAAYTPSSLADCAWYGPMMVQGTQDRAWLEARGVTPAWDKAAGRLTLTVTDPSRFRGHEGEERTLTLTLLPGGGTTSFTVKLLPDIGVSVADGKSLTEGFYLGQKRTLSVSGFAGSTLCYAADQDPCGRSASGAAHGANVQWKATGAESAPFPTVVTDAAGNVSLRPSDYPSQRLSGTSLDIYAFYPNRFRPAHVGWTSRDGKVIIFSEDWLNDSVEVPVRISEPTLRAHDGNLILPIDGTEIPTDCGWWSFDGTERLSAASFDAGLLASRLGVTFSSWNGTHAAWMECVALDPGTGLMSVRRTTSSEGNLEDRRFERVNGAWSTYLGWVDVAGASLPELFGTLPSHIPLYVSALHIDRLRSGLHSSFVDNGTVFQSDYFNGSAQNQLEEDRAFSMRAEFSFAGGDLSRIVWTRSGSAMTYTCRRPPYETVQPVIDFTVDTPDEGSGGTFSWVYDESHQVMASSSGEPVPGGLILPYDTQTMTGTYTNRWDGRSFTVTASFDLTYPVIIANLLVVARPGTENASVWLLPYKTVRYLKRIGAQVDTEARRWMFRLFGRSDWADYVYTSNRYQTRPGTNAYHSPGGRTGMPLTDYSVKYLWEYLYNRTDISVWTQEAASRIDGLYPSCISNNTYLDFNLYTTKFFRQYWQDPTPNVSGIFWTKSEAFL